MPTYEDKNDLLNLNCLQYEITWCFKVRSVIIDGSRYGYMALTINHIPCCEYCKLQSALEECRRLFCHNQVLNYNYPHDIFKYLAFGPHPQWL